MQNACLEKLRGSVQSLSESIVPQWWICSPYYLRVSESDGHIASVRLSNGEVIEAENAVVATGVFFHNAH